MKTWTELPTKREITERLDGFLKAFHHGDFRAAFEHCPPVVFVKGKGMVLRPTLDGAELGEHLSHAMFQFIEGQSAVEEALANADAKDPTTWCKLVTPPSDVDYADLSLGFPGGSVDDEVSDDARATEDGEVLANVHLNGEATDITGRYQLMNENGKWLLAFSNFDVM